MKRPKVELIKNAIYANCILQDVSELKSNPDYDGSTDTARKIFAYYLDKFDFHVSSIMYDYYGVEKGVAKRLRIEAVVDMSKANEHMYKHHSKAGMPAQRERFYTLCRLCGNYIKRRL